MESGQSDTITFPAELGSLYPILDYVKESAKKVGFDKYTIQNIELATEEALVNIIDYAYPEHIGSIQVSVGVEDENWLWIKIEDQGIPFDPLGHAKKFLVKSMESSHTIGGYGTFFITEIMDRVEYERKGDTNCLLLFKQLSPAV